LKELFFIGALALPCLPATTLKTYVLLWDYLEQHFPEYHVVYVYEDETLLNPGAEKTPFYLKMKNGKGLWLWAITKKSA